MTYSVILTNCGNINHEENPFLPLPGTSTGEAVVQSLEEAVATCREYIEMFELGGGNWIGGQVIDTKTNKEVAYISYNGRVWHPTNREVEIKVDDTKIAELLTPRIYYHVTPYDNVHSIYDKGLLPSIGERAKKIGEIEPAVYLFKTFVDCEDAITGWLGDELEDTENLVIFEIKLPRHIDVETSAAEYEVLVKQPIPLNCMSIKQFV